MALQYLFDPNKQFQSIGGVNEVGGFLRVYLNGTDDRAVTYRNFDGGLNEPDIVLDTYGRSVVIVDDTKTYRIEVYNRLGGLMWTISNYKARGGSGGGSGTPVSVEGTAGEIDVYENTVGGVKHFIVSLAENVKNAISSLTSAVNGLALSLGNKKERQTAKEFIGSTTKTVVGVSQNEDGELSVSFGDIPLDNYELKENKKTTVTSYEGSNTYYPTIKAVVDFVNGMMQNLGGKLITDNGDPFTDSASLPTTTPFQGVDIADKDYAYIQGVGTAERWSATVSGTSVSWVQEYAISIPVFTPSQQAAIDSGVTAAMLDTFLTKTGNGSNVTATFTAAGSRNNISTGEKLSVMFGKIAKWFADLKAVAFSGSYNDLSDKPTIPSVPTAYTSNPQMDGTASAGSSGSWARGDHRHPSDTSKQDALPTSGTPSDTYAVNVSGNAATATHLSASARLDTWSSTYDSNNPFVLAAEITWELGTSKNNGAGQLLQFEFANSNYALIRLNYITKGNNVNTTKAVVLNSNFSNSEISDLIRITHFKYDSDTKFAVRVYIKFTGNWQVWSIRQLDAQSGDEGYTNWVPMTLYNAHGSNVAAPTGTSATYVFPIPEFSDSAKHLSDYRGTEGQDGYKNIYGGYNGGTSEFGLGISKRESGETKYTEIDADGITSSGIITAGVGFVGNLNGVANRAVSDSDGNNINTTYAKKISGIYNIDTYLTDGNAFHDVNLRKQLGPRYVHTRGFTPLMMFYGIINFVDIEYADGYEYAAVDFELYNTLQSGTYGTLMASIGMVVPKGTSSIVIPLPFAWNSGSFSPTLYGNFAHRITAGSAVCNAYYYSLPV